ncbi:MAG: AI-2E family transporter [Faecalibacterium sp.]
MILGVLMALAFSVFKIPYGSLVGMLTAICAIIPYVGALISCVVSVFLVLLVDPFWPCAVSLFTLPYSLLKTSSSTPGWWESPWGFLRCTPLWHAMIGGELFGIIGIIFFIPLTAVIIELVKEDACRRIQARESQRSGPSEQ